MLKNLLILLAVSLIRFPIEASTTEINDLTLFKKTVLSLDKDTIVFLDIDFTVMKPCDPALLPCGRHLRKQYLHNLDRKQRELLQSIIALECEEELMDLTYLEIIQQLHEKNIPVLGFTALEIGRYGKIDSLEDWRLTKLKKAGIDFTHSFKDKNLTQLNLLFQQNGNYSILKNGVLFTNRQSKGLVFTAFINLLKFKPKKVVFIDDNLDYLISVEQAAQNLDIEFIGFHYRAAENMLSGFDESIAELQYLYLIEHEHWLTSQQAQRIN